MVDGGQPGKQDSPIFQNIGGHIPYHMIPARRNSVTFLRVAYSPMAHMTPTLGRAGSRPPQPPGRSTGSRWAADSFDARPVAYYVIRATQIPTEQRRGSTPGRRALSSYASLIPPLASQPATSRQGMA